MNNLYNFLKLVSLVLIFFSNTNFLFSQLRNQWIVIDTNDYFVRNSANSVSFANKDNIVGIFTLNHYKYLRAISNVGDNHNIYADSNSNEQWESVAYPSKEKIIITGYKSEIIYKDKYNDYKKYYGLLIISNDSGKTWSNVYLDSNSRLEIISMIDTNYGIAYKPIAGNYFNNSVYINNNDSLLLTEDGWHTWKSIPLPSNIKSQVMQLQCISKNIFLLLIRDYYNYKSYLYSTENGGENWTISAVIPSRMQKMKFIDKNTGWVIGTKDSIYRTRNGGQTWLTQNYIEPGNPYLGLFNLDFFDKEHGIIVGPSAFIIYSSDGGNNWFREYIPSNMINSLELKQILYPSLDVSYVFTDKYIIKRTNKMILKAPTFKRKIFVNPVPITGNLLEWDKIEGADYYEIIMYECSRDSTPLIDVLKYVSSTVVTNTILALDTLNYNMQYAFKIRAFNDSISSEWNPSPGNLLTLRNNKALLLPDILYPDPSENMLYPISFLIRWNSKETVDSYDFILYHQISYNSSEIVARETNYKDTTYFIDSLLPYNAYLIYLNSRRNDTTSETAYCYFITEPATDVNGKVIYTDKNIIQQIIPNPCSDRCIIQFNSEPYRLSSIKLYNSMGVALADFTSAIALINKNNELEFNLSSLNSGLYFIVAKDNHNIYSKSFVVIK